MKLNLPSNNSACPGDGLSFFTLRIDTQPQYSAVKLFVQCARRVKPDFGLEADNTRCCDSHLPSGAGDAVGYSPGDRVAQHAVPHGNRRRDCAQPGLPGRGLAGGSSAPADMRAVFDHSWQLLNPREREILSGLSVFRGGFTREAAHAVTGASCVICWGD